MAQTHFVIGSIKAIFPDIDFEIRHIVTVADKDRRSEFHEFGKVGVFTSEHEEQLLANEVDFVVHSLKDLPTTLRDGLVLAAVPQREDPRDVLCGSGLDRLKQGARVGTGSLRRRSQILSLRPDVTVVPIRGNVGPRLARIEGEDGLDAVILAQAGLRRLGLEGATTEVLDPARFPYAVAQGALGIESRAADTRIVEVLRAIQCDRTRAEVDAERAMMHALGAGCSLPVGAMARWNGDVLSLTSQITSLDGSETIVTVEEGPGARATELGVAAGEALKSKGGARILETSYRELVNHYKPARS